MGASVVVREFNVPVDGMRRGAELCVAHVSDLHFSRWNHTYRAARETLATLKYDVLAVTGDFCDFRRRWKRALDITRRFFEPLAAKAPAFAILGNHDHPAMADATGFPLRCLRDEAVELRIDGARIRIGGICQGDRACGDLEAALRSRNPVEPDATILLVHYPSTVYRIPSDMHCSLILAGHTHGGQIRLPGIGCVWPNDRIPRRLARGLHRVNDRHLHVSSGIGVSLPLRVRINCPPEVALLRLTSAVAL